MNLLSFLSASTVHDLGWTLLHFLWQGLVLAAMLELVLSFVRGAPARHNWAFATLGLMLLAPVVTFLVLHGQGGVAHAGGAVLAMQAGAAFEPVIIRAAPSPWTNWLVLLWLSGIAALSLRAVGGWVLVENLRRHGTAALPADVMARCRALQQQLGVTRPVAFLQSLRVTTPVVVGWLRPVVLLPLSALAGLPTQQLDALILHELAHVRRQDVVINIVLLAAETLLFYHPVVWWVGRRIRIEREHCCDDMAVGACGDAALYVEALATLEAGRLPPGLALAAGGRLKDRAARLLGAPVQARRHGLGALTGLAAVTLLAVSLAVAQPAPPAPAPMAVFQVPQNAVAGTVGITGNSALSTRDVTHEIHTKSGDVLTRAGIEADLTSLKELYRRNGKYFARIEPRITPVGNRTDLTFVVIEGPTIGVSRIDFTGNSAFDAATLKAQLETQESAWHRPLANNGNYDGKYDFDLLHRFYAAHGYADFVVDNVFARISPDGSDFAIAFKLNEGRQYRIGRVAINSKIAALLTPMLSFKSGDIYDKSQLQKVLDAAPPNVRLSVQRDPGGRPLVNIAIDLPAEAPAPKTPSPGFEVFKPTSLTVPDGKGGPGPTKIKADSIRAEVSPRAPGGKLTHLVADGNVVLTSNGSTVRGAHLDVDVADNASGVKLDAALSDEAKMAMAYQQRVTVSPAEVDARIAQLRARNALPTVSDEKSVRETITVQLAWEKTRRPQMASSQPPGTLTLARLLLPLSVNVSPVAVQNTLHVAEQLRALATSCKALENLSQDSHLKGTVFTGPGDVRLGDLSEQTRQMLLDTKAGGGTAVVQSDAGIEILARCDGRG